MPDLSLLMLPVLAALFFFLPGMAAILAFSTSRSGWRKDDVHFITASAGLSLSITVIVMFLLLLFAGATGTPFPFTALPVILALLTGALLALAAARHRLGPGKGEEVPGEAR